MLNRFKNSLLGIDFENNFL